jgi:predicted ferric reductase
MLKHLPPTESDRTSVARSQWDLQRRRVEDRPDRHLAPSRRWHNHHWPRLVVHEAHRWATITLHLFIAVYVAVIILAPHIYFSLVDVTVPFASDYHPVWLSLGIISTEVAVTVGASLLVRERIGYRIWHMLHGLAYLVFVAALLHGLGMGADADAVWVIVLYGVSSCAVVAAQIWRTVDLPRARVALFAATVVTLAVIIGRVG